MKLRPAGKLAGRFAFARPPMTETVIYGVDFGGKKAKELETITDTLREIGRKVPG